MKYSTLALSALVSLAALAGLSARADNMASIAIAPATGAVTLTPQWAIGDNLAGFHHMAQDLSLGGGANQFYSIKGTAIPDGGDIAAFTRYIAGSGAATNHEDIGSKLTPNAYSALTSADPDLGFGSVQLYFIHHKDDGDYFAHIVPSSGTASAVTDLKPMSQPGGPSTGGESGYFGLTFAASNLGYGSNIFYYLRSDEVTGTTHFGTLIPSLAGASADQHDLGIDGHNALVFTGDDVGYGMEQMYYLRLDPITGYTILGTLHPVSGRAADIANLGSVYSALTYVPGDLGFGIQQFYTTGSLTPNWQSVSFAAIEDRLIGAGSFTVAPSASSGLPITLSVVPGSTGAASITGPVAGVFTVTPTAPGIITLQATQVGQEAPDTVFEYNMLRQSFTATGATLLDITGQPASQTVIEGSTAQFTVTAVGATAVSYQWRKAGVAIVGNASATTDTLTLTNVQLSADDDYDVVVTNLSGSIISETATLTVTPMTAPVITNSPLTAAGTVGSPFSFTITASGTVESYSATPLPAGLSINTVTGVISGTPTTVGVTNVTLGATNNTGTSNAVLKITVVAAGVAPVITNDPLTAAGTVGTAFNFTITASGSPTSYSATPLPAGLAINTATGAITGTPTTVGVTNVLLGATNATGTGNATLKITVVAAGVAPVITNDPLTAAGTVGTVFNFTITASGSPTSYSATPLPAGLTINTATGAITGTPTTVGVTNVLLGATNGTGTGNATLKVTVVAAGTAPVITNDPLTAGGTVGTVFGFTITASGSPTSYSAAPLPAGLSINTATGAISGTPTTVGVTNVLLGATNGIGTGNATLKITIVAAGVAPVITNDPLTAAGTVGTVFGYTITASGSPTSYSATPLPAGLAINTATGAITGTPTTVGVTTVVLGATNGTGTGNGTLTITVSAAPVAPVITNDPLTADGVVGTVFDFTITASGSPTSYSATPLPAGLAINTATGAITGTPTTAGVTNVLLGATNGTGTGNATLTITVSAADVAPVITNDPLVKSGIVGGKFRFKITATGTPDISYSASPLPAGLKLNSATGVINGTPTEVGLTSVLLTATNSVGSDTATLNISVTGDVTVTVRGPLGTVISLTEGGIAPPAGTTYSVNGLPAGFVFDPATGQITTPSVVKAAPGTYVVTYVEITTVKGKQVHGTPVSFTITVNPLRKAMSGGFEALLEAPPVPGLPVGKVEIQVDRQTGAFTGRLTHETSPQVYSFKGRLILDATYKAGAATVNIDRGDTLDPLQLVVAFDTTAADDQVFSATLHRLKAGANVLIGQSETGTKLATFTKSSPAPWMGNYTLVLDDPDFPPVNLGTEAAPEGTGYALVSIGANGRLTITGKLGDGTPTTASLAPGADGSYRWYEKPYKKRGYIGGWIRFAPVADGIAPYQVAGITGSELFWQKNAGAKDTNHRAGFGPIAITATAQPWIVPANHAALRSALQLDGNVMVSSFTSDGLGKRIRELPSTLGLDSKTLVLIGDDTDEVVVGRNRYTKGEFKPNGLFTATITLSDSRQVSVAGALLQQPSVVPGTVIGEGYFVVPSKVKGGEEIHGQVQLIAP